jgi:serine/threonine protein kinase
MIDPTSPQPPARPLVSARDPAAGHSAHASATEIASAAIAKAEPVLAHADALPDGTKLGEFEILSLLGVGGFGMVYRAYDHSLHRTVAIKEYMPSAMAGRSQGLTMATRSSTDQQTLITGLRSFVSEARLLAQFDHPSLVKVYRFWEANNTAYMSMPLYRGVTLRQARLLLQRPPTEEWLRTVLWAILGALKYLHENNIVHRDVSPDNIFLQELGPPVLLDLGAARRTISETSHRHTAILKVNYAPIEQYAGAGDMRQGPWTDLYSVAAVVHGCMCNEPPLPATFRVLRDRMPTFSSVAKTVEAHFGQTYSDEFVATIEHAMAIQPQNRPQSVQAFCDEMALESPEDIQRFVWADGFSAFAALTEQAAAELSTEDAAATRKKPGSKTADLTPTLDTNFEPERTILMPHPSVAQGQERVELSAMEDSEFSGIGNSVPDAQAVAPKSSKSSKSAKPPRQVTASKPNRWLFAGAVCVGLIGLALWLGGSGGGSLMGSKNSSGTSATRPLPVPETGPGSETIISASPSPSAAASATALPSADATALVPSAVASAPVAAASTPLSAASAAQAAASAAARRAALAAKLPSSAASASQSAAANPNTPADAAATGNNQRSEPAPGTVPARMPTSNAATAPAPARSSPQAACAEANFFTRPMCIFNECEKPEFTRLPFCVENRKRLVESQQRNQNP